MATSFIQELKRRNVFRVTAVYVIASWLLMQIGDVMFPALLLPEWTTSMLVAFLLLGFPISIIFAWAYEVTPDGIKRTEDVVPDESITDATGQKINYVIIAVLLVAVILLIGKISLDTDTAPATDLSISEKSIAVLPFANRSADSENAEFFAAGVHDELLTLLSKLGDLKVISRTSVERLDENLSIPEIGALLKVATVLEGQVQRAGDRLRINVQLIKTTEEDHLWATTYDRELTASNIFDVQSSIARTIANELHVQLTSDDDTLLSTVPTNNTEALQLYMLGRQHYSRGSWESLKQAQEYFSQAVELDPDYVQAWTAIAAVGNRLFGSGGVSLQAFADVAEPAIARALELDDRSPEAHAQLASLRWRSGDLEAAEASFKKALNIDSEDMQTLFAYGNYLRTVSRPQEAITVLEQALEADPLSPLILFELGKSEMYVGHPEKNLEYAERILEIDPSSVYGYGGALQANIWMGRLHQTWYWMMKSIAADPDDFENWAYLGTWYDMLGDIELADRYLDHALSMGPTSPAVLKCQVQVLMNRGLHEEGLTVALSALHAGLEHRWFSTETFLRQVRNDALRTGDYQDALAWYIDRYPELQGNSPDITIDNIQAAADLALLLQSSGESQSAVTLLDAALTWYRNTQPPGVHGILTNIVDVQLLALRGEKTAALGALREAVDSGWRYDWPLHVKNKNLDSIRDEPGFKSIVAQLEADMATQLEAIYDYPDMGEFDWRTAKSE